MVRGFATVSQAIQACRDEQIVIVLNGRPCAANQSFVDDLWFAGARFRGVLQGHDEVLRVDFPCPANLGVGVG